MHQKNPIAFKSTDYDLYTLGAGLGRTVPRRTALVLNVNQKRAGVAGGG